MLAHLIQELKDLAPIEIKRLENIQRNQDVLQSLGLKQILVEFRDYTKSDNLWREAEQYVEDSNHSFNCPITQSLMHDPVLATDGHTYERANILEWYKTPDTYDESGVLGVRSPLAGFMIQDKTLKINHTMKQDIKNAIASKYRELAAGWGAAGWGAAGSGSGAKRKRDD